MRGLNGVGFVPQIPMEKFCEFLKDKKDHGKVNVASLKDQYRKLGIRTADDG